jgi:hypothetical protein
MNKDGDNTIIHLELILWLAERLSGYNLAIYRHEYDQLCFGSWIICFGLRHNKLKAIYDGKENVLRILNRKQKDSRASENWEDYRIIENIKPDQAIDKLLDISAEYFGKL